MCQIINAVKTTFSLYNHRYRQPLLSIQSIELSIVISLLSFILFWFFFIIQKTKKQRQQQQMYQKFSLESSSNVETKQNFNHYQFGCRIFQSSLTILIVWPT